MSAVGITDTLCGALERRDHDFLLCNFANADMVGHTGVLSGGARGRRDGGPCLGRIVAAAEASRRPGS